MCDVDDLKESPASDEDPNVKTSKLRRVSGSLDMSSGLRVVNVSPDTEQSQRLTEDDIISPISKSVGGATVHVRSPTDERRDLMSSVASQRPPSVFDIPEEPQDEHYTDNTEQVAEQDSADDLDSYNLKPPPPIQTHQLHNGLEELSDRLFSGDHLDVILKDYALATRFTQFLKAYRPIYLDTLKEYTEAKKASVAIEYANSIVHHLHSPNSYSALQAARLDDRFETAIKQKERTLVEEALPAYLTHRLVCLVTDTLAKEITGNSAPIMHELIPSLAEVYCLSDPSVRDNPIVYASEEFYNITQYTKEFTIGRNCRFLQGPKSSDAAVARLIQALAKGEECCETILNYKRDGTPFMNLLMIAPLYDNKGSVRYFLGCQIDVSSLVENGRGLESFAQLLAQDRTHATRKSRGSKKNLREPVVILSDWGQLLSEEEAEIVRNRVHAPSSPQTSMSSSSKVLLNRSGSKSGRIILGMDQPDPPLERQLWPAADLGKSGRLPGVYQTYLLVRPYPSLRITFTSPSLRIPGLLQTKLLDRIGGPAAVRDGLLEALMRGTGVTAKVNWLTANHHSIPDLDSGRPRWLHCTPLFGSDDRVGVWMVVVCDDDPAAMPSSSLMSGGAGNGAQRFTSSKLYADYLKREGRESGSRPLTAHTNDTNGSSLQARADDRFRDF